VRVLPVAVLIVLQLLSIIPAFFVLYGLAFIFPPYPGLMYDIFGISLRANILVSICLTFEPLYWRARGYFFSDEDGKLIIWKYLALPSLLPLVLMLVNANAPPARGGLISLSGG